MNSGSQKQKAPMVAGLIVIVVGTVLLLNQFGILPQGFVLHFWPMVLVVVGIIKLVSGDHNPDRVVGGCLVIAGVLWQTNSLGITHITINQIWPVGIILVGVMLVVHALSDDNYRNIKFTTDPESGSFYIFGGGERKVTARDFRGSKMFAMFGGYEIDLTNADMEGTEAYVEANAIFGGGEISVPINWKVVVQGTGIFGGYNDKTHYMRTDPNAPVKTLYVRGVAIFGGVEVKN